MNTPDIDLAELELLKKKNFEERLEFIKKYAEWTKKHDNWSTKQKELIG
jgi:hypothetical protein